MQEQINMQGQVTLRLTDAAGRMVHEQQRRNRIVLAGRHLVAQLFGGVTTGTPPTAVTHMAVGTDATAAADDQTALLKERAPRKKIKPDDVAYSDFDEAQPGGGTVRRVRAALRAVFDFDEANGAKPLREAGIFTAADLGVMYNRVVFDPVSKTNAFQLTLLWR